MCRDGSEDVEALTFECVLVWVCGRHARARTGFCDMCYPNFPKGVEVLGHAGFAWASTNLSSVEHAYRTHPLLPYYISGASYKVGAAGHDSKVREQADSRRRARPRPCL